MGIFFCLLCIFLWSLIPVVAKLGQVKISHHSFLFFSSLISFITLYAIAIFRDKRLIMPLPKCTVQEFFKMMVLGLLGTYVYYLLLYYGYKTAKGIEVLIFQYTWPIFMVLFSIILLQSKVSLKKIIGLLLGFFGVIIAFTHGETTSFSLKNTNYFSLLLVLVGSMCFALFSVLSKDIKKDVLLLNTFYFLCATIFSFLYLMLFSKLELPSKESLLPILINGCFVNGISYVFWIEALKKIDSYLAATLVFLTPILAAIYLILFFKEPFEISYLISLFLIITAGMICRA